MVAPHAVRRVVVDGAALTDGSQYRGIGTYLRNVASGLGARADFDVTVLLPAGAAELPHTGTVRTSTRVLPPRWRAREDEWRLPRDLHRVDAQLLHSPAQGPPRRSRMPWVQTLHDLTPLVFRHPLLEADRRRWLRVGPRLRSAGAVICVSASSARQGVELLGLDPARVHVVPLGVDPSFAPAPFAAGGSSYLLWVSAWGPHKGLGEALRVLSRLAAAGLPHRLVVAGRQDTWMRARIDETVAGSDVHDRVDVVGYVDDMPALYRNAAALLMTSRAEGFGLPALEAMACGVPVVAFANTSLPEVVGDAGLLVPDGDTDEMAEQVLRLLRDDTLAADLSRRGVARAASFTWDRTVDAHAEIFGAVIDRG